jgi:uncharacterized protein (UPF0335 family)
MRLYDYDIEEMSMNEMLDVLNDTVDRIKKLEGLKAPETILEFERGDLQIILNKLSNYFDMKTIETIAEKRKKEKKEEWKQYMKSK